MTATGSDTARKDGDVTSGANVVLTAAAKKAIAALPADDPLAAVRRRKEKIAIVGFTEHRQQALELPRDEWALWGLNELYRYMPLDRFDLWCEIHDWNFLAKETQDEVPKPWPRHVVVMAEGFAGHPATAGGFSIPIYLQERRADVKLSHAFPREFVKNDLPGDLGAYKTSAPAWMLGMAMALDFREIHLYGIDMATDTEYAEQRPCMEFLLGVAAGRGIEIYVPQTSDLIHSVGEYAFGPADYFTQKLLEREKWLMEQLAGQRNMHAQIEKAYVDKKAELEELYRVEKSRCEGAIHEILGQLSNMRYLKRAWAIPASANANGKPFIDRTQDPRTGIGKDSVLANAKPRPQTRSTEAEAVVEAVKV